MQLYAFIHPLKKISTMKLPKSLLGAILVGITMQTATSCKKDKAPTVKEEKKEATEKKSIPSNCPGCGMG
ncbi:hypothetical protein DF182_17190 [Chitinophaga flava]|uniref:Uncharacterized protein n=2 Tax=Chitinophaga flava TaxID=2259036 RepID=A0A365XPQ7_9BACT|nr:hypothetical protein DF182_17190 [Chitinophaga flava]